MTPESRVKYGALSEIHRCIGNGDDTLEKI